MGKRAILKWNPAMLSWVSYGITDAKGPQPVNCKDPIASDDDLVKITGLPRAGLSICRKEASEEMKKRQVIAATKVEKKSGVKVDKLKVWSEAKRLMGEPISRVEYGVISETGEGITCYIEVVTKKQRKGFTARWNLDGALVGLE